MVDPLKKHLDKLKIIAESAKRRNNMYADLAKLDNRHAKRSLSALHNAPAPGKKIQKIGFITMDTRANRHYMCCWWSNDISW